MNGQLADGHVPGPEYFHGVNGALNHRLAIIPSRNMICNIGMKGEHAKGKKSRFFNIPTYEVSFPIKHPMYVIDDKKFGQMYSKALKHPTSSFGVFINKIKFFFRLLFSGKMFHRLKSKKNNSVLEK